MHCPFWAVGKRNPSRASRMAQIRFKSIQVTRIPKDFREDLEGILSGLRTRGGYILSGVDRRAPALID